MSSFIFVVTLGLCFCSKATSNSSLGRPELSGPDVALVDDIVDFTCEVQTYPNDEPILLQLFKEGNRSKVFAEYTSMNGEMAHFPLIVKFDHEGDLECVASVQNNSLIQPNVSETHYLRVVEPVDGAQLVVHSGQTEIFEGDPLVMLCDVIAGTRVSFRWLVDDQPVPQHPLNLTSQSDLLFINRTSTQDSGSYMCVATNQFNKTQYFTSNSTAVLITVKEHVSNPNISFTVIEDFQHYSVLVTCRSTRGTPPVTFSLYNKKAVISNQTVDDLYASFNVPLILEPHLGELQCRADNGNRIGYSQWMTLDVVAVHGPVMMHYDYDMGENFAVVGLRFYCSVAKGSHPRYQWFLNRTLLEGRGTFYWVVHQPPERSILHVSAETRTAGTYHCEVTDRFNNTTVLKSEKWYFNKEALNRLSVVVVAAVFGCFVFLVSLVSVCCCVGLVIRRWRYGKKSLWELEMENIAAANEEELDLTEYREDVELMRATRMNESDQVSVSSTDEWPEIEKMKKTLEDEPVQAF